MFLAVELVRQRLFRTAAILEAAGIPYAVVGGHAVAAHVAKVDPSATRNTQDVDILINRSDLEAAKAAMTAAGFVYANVFGVDMFLDGPDARPRDAVHLLFANEKVKDTDVVPCPSLDETQVDDKFRLTRLESLVRMKLVSYRLKDQVHLQDMLEVGLIDASWVGRYPPELGQRLQKLIDTPGG